MEAPTPLRWVRRECWIPPTRSRGHEKSGDRAAAELVRTHRAELSDSHLRQTRGISSRVELVLYAFSGTEGNTAPENLKAFSASA